MAIGREYRFTAIVAIRSLYMFYAADVFTH